MAWQDELMDQHAMWLRFTEDWCGRAALKRGNKMCISNLEYHDRMIEVKLLKQALQTGQKIRTQKDTRLLRMYDVVTVFGVERLVKPLALGQVPDNQLPMYVTIEDMFDVLHEAHRETDHGQEEQMIELLRTRYCNVTREAVQVYLSVCCCNPRRMLLDMQMVPEVSMVSEVPTMEMQQQQQHQLPAAPAPQPHVHGGSSVFFGFYGMEMYARDGYSHIMIHWDVTTKFVHLVPLRTVHAVHVASKLLDIYSTFGMPYFLDAPYEVTYIHLIVNHMKSMWNGEVSITCREASNMRTLLAGLTTIHQMMDPWVKDVEFQQNWPWNLKVLQNQLNTQLFQGSSLTPHQRMFGYPAIDGNDHYNV